MSTRIDALRAQMGGPRDGALLRFSLGSALLEADQAAPAADALREALEFDPEYSAAWKLLGKACQASDDDAGATAAWTRGIAVAHGKGDTQAEKEMTVFLRRLAKQK